MMMTMLGLLVFGSAFAASAAVFWYTLVPAMPRIVAILRDGVDPHAPVGARRPAIAVISEPRLRARIPVAVAPARPVRCAAA